MIEPAALDALLPQTQCTQCGFAGCLPYAEAIVAGRAGINQCAPGGDDGIRRLSALTGLPYVPLNPAHGSHRPRVLAVIDEAACIGCTICIQKCPVDAIAGAAKLMHTVLAFECTGCELCVAPCPVDCIALIPVPATHPAVTSPALAADVARRRHRARLARLQRLAQQRDAPPLVGSPEHKRRAIAAAQQRARARRNRESAT
ncbi:MAG: RnfABCDGE type electron transport complex subunit B [Betaproteobacteria bacterium]